MALISQAFKKFQITEPLASFTADIDEDKRYPTHELLHQLIALKILGGEAIDDVRLLTDPDLVGMF